MSPDLHISAPVIPLSVTISVISHLAVAVFDMLTIAKKRRTVKDPVGILVAIINKMISAATMKFLLVLGCAM